MAKLCPDSLRLGLIQMRMEEDRETNLDKARSMIADAAKRGAHMVCLPELFTSPYFPQDSNAKALAESIPGPTTTALSKCARDNGVVLIGGSIYERARSGFYNSSLVFDKRGKLLGKYRKVHIPQDPSFYEQNFFSSGDGFKVIHTERCNIGVLICFDQWYPEAARINRLLGADIVFYPTAIGWVKGIAPVEGDWHEAWEKVQVGHAISNSMIVCAVNRVGVEKDMTFWGGSFVSDQFGKILVRGDDREGVFVADCNLALGKDIEEGWGFLRNRRPRAYKRLQK